MIKDGINAYTIDSSLVVNMNGRRVPKYVNKPFPYKYVFVDEIYACNSYHLNLIYDLWLNNMNDRKVKETPKLKMYFFGGKEQTIAPEIEDDTDRSIGVCYDYDKSQALMDMCWNLIKLEYNPKTARYGNKLYEESKKVLNRKTPTLQIGKKGCSIFICKTNKMVDKMNDYMMKKIKNGDKFQLPKSKQGSRSLLTTITLEAGSPIVPYSNKSKFYNNEDFEYVSKQGPEVNVKRLSNDEVISIDHDMFCKNFIPAYAGTVNRFQGSKIENKYCIMEPNKMNQNDLYTAITRGTKWSNVCVHKKIQKIKPYKYIDCKLIKVKPLTKEGFIYKITNKINNEFYVGKTNKTLEERFNKHITTGLNKKDKFHEEIKKYGSENFVIEMLEKVIYRTDNDILRKEKKYIIALKPQYNSLCVYKRYRPKPKIINHKIDINNIKGISFDEKLKRYRVRYKGIKTKQFTVKKYGGKEQAFQKAVEYLTGYTDTINEFA